MEQGTEQQTSGQQSKSPRMHLQQGLLEIYCGDGKGKTTAALGLALRAAGCGLRVHIVQFLKGTETGELASLAQIPQISLVRCDKNWGFTFSMTEQDKKEITVCHNQMLQEAISMAKSGEIDVLIFDEFQAAYAHGLLDKEAAKDFILKKPATLELVLTGRNPDPVFLEAADYVSEIHGVRHPYQKQIPARAGGFRRKTLLPDRQNGTPHNQHLRSGEPAADRGYDFRIYGAVYLQTVQPLCR